MVLTPNIASDAVAPQRFISHGAAEREGRVHSSQGSVIVASDAFDPGWQATAVPVAGTSTLVLPHFAASGYANAWFLPAGDWFITIRFLPQTLFARSAFISTVGLPILFILVTIKRQPLQRLVRELRRVRLNWTHVFMRDH